MKIHKAGLLIPTLLAATVALAVAPPEPYGATPSTAQLDWHEVELYGLLCYNMATFTNEEWAFGDTPVEDFNPSDFSAEQIVDAAKAGGLKGLVIVAKHHDGFCLWPTKTTDYNIAKTPYKDGKGDLVGEIAAACRRHGLKFGVYVSPWDRNHARYGFPEYAEAFREQWRELMTQYGELFMLWLDGANGGTGYYGGARERRNIDRQTYYGWPDVFAMMQKMQPSAVIFSDIGPGVRWVGNEKGIANDPCWATMEYPLVDGKAAVPGLHFPPNLLNSGIRGGSQWVPAEADVSIRPGWFYHPEQNGRVRSPQNLADLYFKSIGRGASLNLGLPPMPAGQLHSNDVESLAEFGRWQRETFAVNLAADAKVSAEYRGGARKFAPENLLDGDRDSYWATDDDMRDAAVVFDLGEPVTFNVIDMREYLPLGQRVQDWAVDVRRNGVWFEIASGTAIGSRRLLRLPDTAAAQVRLRLMNTPVCPALSEFGLYREPDWIRRGESALARSFSGVSRKNWRVLACSYAAPESGAPERAIDGKIETLWHTHGPDGERGAPQWIAIDMGEEISLGAFLCTPRQDGTTRGVVDRYAFHVSSDGENWELAAEGEFGNIAANPIQQRVDLSSPVKARYFKFSALHSVNGIPLSVAELGVIRAGD
jgi:alpha-L-fucosidase